MACKVMYDEEVSLHPEGAEEGSLLCFQRCTYRYSDANSEAGFRFIWRRPNGNLQPARGQARIPDSVTLTRLITMAREAGWFA